MSRKEINKQVYKEVFDSERNKYDYGYGIVTYDYDSISNNNGDYSTIVNGRITEINCSELYNFIRGKYKISNINDYCLDRFIRKSFNKDVVSFVTISGYYGPEADFKINDTFSEELNNLIIGLNNNENNTKLIEKILIIEYGYILPELKNKKWSFEKIELKYINPTAGMKHVKKSIVDQYKKEVVENKYNLTCLCQKKSTTNYRLIDGYHRFSAANQSKLKEIDCIVCE